MIGVVTAGCVDARPVPSADIEVPKGFRIEAVAKGLAAPAAPTGSSDQPYLDPWRERMRTQWDGD